MSALLDRRPQSGKDTGNLFAEAAGGCSEEVGKMDVWQSASSSSQENGGCELPVKTEELAGESDQPLKVLSKTALVDPLPEDFDLLVDRLQIRLREGQGECLQEVGVAEHSDDAGISEEEMKISERTLRNIASKLNAEISHLRTKSIPGSNCSFTADYLVRIRPEPRDFMEVRVAVVGNVDAGKSTLLGVLTHGELDNGRGQARLMLFRHKHEIESGRTSSVGNDILGFDALGNIVNNPDPHDGHLDWVKICENATKVVTFIDLAGHEKYLKTTIFGMTGHLPDYCMLMIGANAGVVGMCKEHLGLALALNVPVFVVVTKIDMCPAPVLQDTLKLLQKLLKSPGCRKLPVMVQSPDDVVISASNFTSERICPIFQVSNVTGHNLDLLKMFLNLLSIRSDSHENDPAEFQIDDTYLVPGVGTVVSGTCLRGNIKLNDNLLLGPKPTGEFISVPVKSIHRKRMPVKEVRGGQTASFALKKIKRSEIRKGMVMVAPVVQPVACWEFEGEILVLHHPTTISPKYQAMVHAGPIRQTATIMKMSKDCLRTGDKAEVRFRFIKNPEFLKEGTRIVFREGRTKAVGSITKVFPHLPSTAASQRLKKKQGEVGASGMGSGSQRQEVQRASKRRGGVQQREKQRKAAGEDSVVSVPESPNKVARNNEVEDMSQRTTPSPPPLSRKE